LNAQQYSVRPYGTSADQLVLDSSYFTVLLMLCDEMRAVLHEQGDMNTTQYRVLLKVYAEQGDRNRVSDLAESLGLQANVVTQAANALEAQQLVRRVAEPGDARARAVLITGAGIVRVVHIDAALSNHLYSVWDPVSEDWFRAVQEAIIAVGAGVEHSDSQVAERTSVQSRYLAALVGVEEAAKNELRRTTGASFNECRIMQRLAEVAAPIREMDLASTLNLQPNTVTRTANRLENRDWVRRVVSPDHANGVLLQTTPEGDLATSLILETIDRVAEKRIWSKLDEFHTYIVRHIGAAVLQGLRTGHIERHWRPVAPEMSQRSADDTKAEEHPVTGSEIFEAIRDGIAEGRIDNPGR